MRVEVIKHYVTDEDGTHLRVLCTSDGKVAVEGHSRTLRALLAAALGTTPDQLELIEVGRVVT